MSDIIQQIRDAYTENPAKAFDRLPELFKAVDDGKIVESPCKIGDKVTAQVVRPFNGHILQIGGEVSDVQLVVRITHDEIRHTDFLASDFGKTVFLRESAEAALRGKK